MSNIFFWFPIVSIGYSFVRSYKIWNIINRGQFNLTKFYFIFCHLFTIFVRLFNEMVFFLDPPTVKTLLLIVLIFRI